ncbi:MAG: energy-dependent translational throttle protein EttA [Holosporales bacterium]|jgi:ATP-binding cassette ChvD family protein|nr:energy-dependent translational throttle protein EttA [Holosporales bacterium]
MSSYQYIYVMKGLSKAFPGGKQVLKETWLSFLPGANIGIIGGNGAGKSTLMKIMADLDKDYQGEAWLAKDATVGYLPQEPALDNSLSVRGNIIQGFAEKKSVVDEYEALSAKFAEPMDDVAMQRLLDRQAELQNIIDAQDLWDLNRQVEIAMDALRCPPGDQSVESLSGGERRRVALCRLLLQKPDLLLLDEPTNHLDAESIAWLERHLQEYKGTVVLVTHDRYFLDNVVKWILELDRGQAYPFEGNYSAWLEDKQKRLELEGKQDDSRKKTIERELEWIKQSPKARQSKSKARIRAYDELLVQDERNAKNKQAAIYIPPGPRLGDSVLKAEKLSKAYADKLLFDDLSFNLPAGGIVGVIGPNGAGKSTLFRIIVGEEASDTGTLKVGETVKIAYVNQSRDSLDSGKTIWEEISGGLDELELGKRRTPSRAYVASFGFKGTDQQKKINQLSGGERNRVHLAKLLKQGANLILLDEPTNDLDVETLRALEDALIDFAGCAVVISHDRWFLDRIATHILAFEGNSRVEWFEGNYGEYAADYHKRYGIDADSPKRVKYKPLSRNV